MTMIKVRLNGCALHPREMRQLSGYVLQTDILPAMLTVRSWSYFIMISILSMYEKYTMCIAKRKQMLSFVDHKVRECLEFQAKLRVSEPTAIANVRAAANSRDAQMMRVDATLKRLKLVRQQNTIVGNTYKRGLSGM